MGAEPSRAGAGRARAQRAVCPVTPLLNAPGWDEQHRSPLHPHLPAPTSRSAPNRCGYVQKTTVDFTSLYPNRSL